MSRFIIFGLTILLAFAPAALAVDGTVLINQSMITNGLTGCPTGGHFPIIICQSGSYRLSGNLAVPVGSDAIHIAASNVTLDLNGFSITSTNVMTSPITLGVTSVGGPSGVTIRNGNIRGFNLPLQPDLSQFPMLPKFWILEDLVLEETGFTLSQMFLGSYSTIRHVHAINEDVEVTCPSIVVETTGNFIGVNSQAPGSGSCAFANNTTPNQ